MHTHIREVGTDIQLVQEVTLLSSVDNVEVVVRTDGQTIIVRLTIVTTYDTLLCIVAHRQVVVHLLCSATD